MRKYLESLAAEFEATRTVRKERRVRIIIRKMMTGIISKEEAIARLTRAILRGSSVSVQAERFADRSQASSYDGAIGIFGEFQDNR